ncbi:SDR family oxidoreductase [Paludibacterium yongneupense]|uniref:SDR family oxidoreductase n=1 Tax=Paludibacterium yongneupense TaxID=400061 RepID=UPI000402F7E8|nr:SDR family oxidoreductase [Paludibacterium yongneupense]
MRVFVTGATGFIGSAVVAELLGAGHEVLGLVRSDKGVAALEQAGAKVHRGSLEDTAGLRKAVAWAEGVVHTGFNHDFSHFAENCMLDRRAIEAMGEELAASERPIVIAAGTGLIVKGRAVREDDPAPRISAAFPRASEAAADALVERGIHASVVRLPPSVHGAGDHGFVPVLIDIARRHGVSAYIGEGLNPWAAVHRLDAAAVFRLALERAAKGVRYHAVAEERIPFRDIATEIGRQLQLPVEGRSQDEAQAHFTWFTAFAEMEAAASAHRTREWLGWAPVQPSLLDDMRQSGYFAP